MVKTGLIDAQTPSSKRFTICVVTKPASHGKTKRLVQTGVKWEGFPLKNTHAEETNEEIIARLVQQRLPIPSSQLSVAFVNLHSQHLMVRDMSDRTPDAALMVQTVIANYDWLVQHLEGPLEAFNRYLVGTFFRTIKSTHTTDRSWVGAVILRFNGPLALAEAVAMELDAKRAITKMTPHKKRKDHIHTDSPFLPERKKGRKTAIVKTQ